MRARAHGIYAHGTLALLLILAFAGQALAAERADLAKLDAQALSPVVQVNRTCSGALVHSARGDKGVETFVVTAKHCVSDTQARSQTVYVPVYQGNRVVREAAYRASVEGVSFKADVALLRLADTETLFPGLVRLAPDAPDLVEGEDVWTVGYSRGGIRTVTEGLFGARESIPFPSATADTEYFRATAQIAGGNSGGALFRRTAAGDYEMIGLTTAVVPPSDFIGYYTPIETVRAYLKQRSIAGRPEPFGGDKHND